MYDNTTGSSGVAPRFHDQIEEFLQTTLKGLSRETVPPKPASAGRPQQLPSSSLWMAVLVCVLRGMRSQRAIWRLLAACGLWGLPCYDIVDQAVYKRLEQEGSGPLEQLFGQISQLLAQWLEPAKQAYEQKMGSLASFATEVVALDEMWADPVTRRFPRLACRTQRGCRLAARPAGGPLRCALASLGEPSSLWPRPARIARSMREPCSSMSRKGPSFWPIWATLALSGSMS